jgi:hypothetical protein
MYDGTPGFDEAEREWFAMVEAGYELDAGGEWAAWPEANWGSEERNARAERWMEAEAPAECPLLDPGPPADPDEIPF